MDQMRAASVYERTEKPTASHKPSRTEDVRQVVQDYANDLREILEVLRRLLN